LITKVLDVRPVQASSEALGRFHTAKNGNLWPTEATYSLLNAFDVLCFLGFLPFRAVFAFVYDIIIVS